MADGERRYDGRTEHADWCADHDHEGYCLDVLLGVVDELERTRRAHGCTEECQHRADA